MRVDKVKQKDIPCFKKQKNSENDKTVVTSINEISLGKANEISY